jgi:hypothetical protein
MSWNGLAHYVRSSSSFCWVHCLACPNRLPWRQCFFTGKFLPNFDLKNINLTYTKDFHGKFDPNLPDFEEFFKSPDFYDMFQ